jgi:N-acetylglucosaminyldiphosphoundecaprenol N-acetyl-beta-D-mannosaminyltransferase
MRPSVFGVSFDPVDQSGLIVELLRRARNHLPGYVVPTNLHIVVSLRNNAALRCVLDDPAALVVPDGRPLLWMARLRGIKMELITGSDLIIPLCRAAAREGLSVFFLGTTFESLTECARKLSSWISGLHIAGIYSPRFDLEGDPHERELVANIIQAAAADIVFVALGVPKQEIWAQVHATKLNIQVICIGAGLDFLAGRQRRAPSVLRRLGFEWLWRVTIEPRRLGVRYLNILGWLPFLFAREMMIAVRLWTK